jgi:hypothetical protein
VGKAGLTLGSYDAYRRNKKLPRANEAVEIAKALGTSVEYLVTGNIPHPLTESQILNEAFKEIEGTIDKYKINPRKNDRKKP